jgi:hypothetical protein
MKKRQTNNYVNNKQLYEVLVDFIAKRQEAIASDREIPRIPNYVGECITLIATRLATKPNFSGYSFIDEMISDGIENCIMYIHNFNPNKSTNPFGYITLIIHHAFVRRIEKEAKHSYVRHKMMVQGSHLRAMEYGGDFDSEEFENLTGNNNDTSNSIIHNFETKLADKKAKKKEKARLDAEALENEDE